MNPRWIAALERHAAWFGWVRRLYPAATGFPPAHLLPYVVPQKVFRVNGSVPWPVHFTSRVLYWRNVELGHRCAPGMSAGCYVQARNGIRAGHNLRVGPNVGLISANHDLEDYDRHLPCDPIVIGDNVWLGMNTVVMPGVKIGSNVVVGANSVVTADLPSNVVAAGNPCRVVRPKAPYTGRDYARL